MERSRVSNASFGSPLQTSRIDRLEEDKKYIIKKLNYLFVMYAARSSRYTYNEIHETSFMQLMVDAYEAQQLKLIKNSDHWKKIVTLYYGKGKKIAMTYEAFLKILPGISELFLINHSHSNEGTLKYLLKHLMMVYEHKVAQSIEQKYVEFDNTFTNETVEYLQKLNPNLYTIYKLYFPEEMRSNHQLSDQGEPIFEKVVLLFKEFEIFPKIISASHLYLIYSEISNAKADNFFSWADQKWRRRDRLSSFGFSKYLQLLVRVAMVSIDRLREVEDPEWWFSHQKECLKALFEYMESIRTKPKNARFQHVRFSLILSSEYKIERQKWQSLSMDPQLRPLASHGDFFQMFEKMML